MLNNFEIIKIYKYSKLFDKLVVEVYKFKKILDLIYEFKLKLI